MEVVGNDGFLDGVGELRGGGILVLVLKVGGREATAYLDANRILVEYPSGPLVCVRGGVVEGECPLQRTGGDVGNFNLFGRDTLIEKQEEELPCRCLGLAAFWNCI